MAKKKRNTQRSVSVTAACHARLKAIAEARQMTIGELVAEALEAQSCP